VAVDYVLELCVSIGMRHALGSLANRAETVAELVQESADRRGTDLPALLRHRRRELRSALARPPERRHRVAASDWIDELLERLLDARLGLRQGRPTCPRPSHFPIERDACFEFLPASAQGLSRKTSRCGDQCVATVSKCTRLRCPPESSTAFVENTGYRGVLRHYDRLTLHVSPHTAGRSRHA
jgi:hypothetical protein